MSVYDPNFPQPFRPGPPNMIAEVCSMIDDALRGPLPLSATIVADVFGVELVDEMREGVTYKQTVTMRLVAIPGFRPSYQCQHCGIFKSLLSHPSTPIQLRDALAHQCFAPVVDPS